MFEELIEKVLTPEAEPEDFDPTPEEVEELRREPEAEPEYVRVKKCPVCRRPADRGGHDLCEPVTSEEALEMIEPMLATWMDPMPPVLMATVALDGGTLKAFWEALRHVSDEVRLLIGGDGWRVRAVDPAHVAMVDVALPRERFSEYELRDDGGNPVEELEVGIDLAKLKDVVKRAKTETVRMEFRDAYRLELTVGGMLREMRLVDTAGMTDPQIPKLVFGATVALDGKILADFLRDAAEVSDHVSITVTPDGVTLEAEGDVDKVRQVLEAGTEGLEYRTTVKGSVRSLFPLDYLTSAVKPLRKHRIEISVNQDYPLRMSWDAESRGTYLLAPRIESE